MKLEWPQRARESRKTLDEDRKGGRTHRNRGKADWECGGRGEWNDGRLKKPENGGGMGDVDIGFIVRSMIWELEQLRESEESTESGSAK
ncbi:hypothetical protein Y1Q_0007953 [Alligator mississippiensis]|uniref:Uncharacterized protein n=1 Tax=Alligator mississippiensis TaxID=8496 RepID=A0A151NFR1_ALLMI|nr:hypothetical protein Y1Q_0007953 [Alligator mississippiensis]